MRLAWRCEWCENINTHSEDRELQRFACDRCGVETQLEELTVLGTSEETCTFTFEESQATFQTAINTSIRGLWTGAMSDIQFFDSMLSTIDIGLNQAWKQGAAVCGILPEEFTTQETTRLNQIIVSQRGYIDGLADRILSNVEAGGKLGPLLSQAKVWGNRWSETFNVAQTMACGNQKLMWVLGVAEHCDSCKKLNGKVKRANFWNEQGILPAVAGAPYLACGGWRCACRLVPTDAPASRGRLPNLP